MAPLPKLHCTRFLGQQAPRRLIPPPFKREFRIVFRIDATPRDLVTPVDPPSIPSAESGLFSRYVGFNRISRVPALPILLPPLIRFATCKCDGSRSVFRERMNNSIIPVERMPNMELELKIMHVDNIVDKIRNSPLIAKYYKFTRANLNC